ncbi:MAG: hypothetical protein RL442_44 [Pseudomonadota bacterium]|jgi:hypothetical protein
MEALDDLASQWRIAKAKEESAKELRVFLENEILKLHPAREEGSETFTTANGFKIKLTAKLNYKVDVGKLVELTMDWQEDARPIKTKIEADETKLKAIRAEAPRLWSDIAPAVTVTPAKVGVTIEPRE